MRQDFDKIANELDEIAGFFKHFAKIMRGEIQDMTGIGHWRILCGRLERTMDCKVITKEQYEAFKKLSDEEFKRLGGQTKY